MCTFPVIQGNIVLKFHTWQPFVVFLPIPYVSKLELVAVAPASLVDDLVDHYFFHPVFCDYYAQIRKGLFWEVVGVIGSEGLEEAGVESRERLVVVREAECVFQLLRVGLDNCVGAVPPWHEFCNMFSALAFVVVSSVGCGEHDKVTCFIYHLLAMVFVSMIGLADLGCSQHVLCLLHIGL